MTDDPTENSMVQNTIEIESKATATSLLKVDVDSTDGSPVSNYHSESSTASEFPHAAVLFASPYQVEDYHVSKVNGHLGCIVQNSAEMSSLNSEELVYLNFVALFEESSIATGDAVVVEVPIIQEEVSLVEQVTIPVVSPPVAPAPPVIDDELDIVECVHLLFPVPDYTIFPGTALNVLDASPDVGELDMFNYLNLLFPDQTIAQTITEPVQATIEDTYTTTTANDFPAQLDSFEAMNLLFSINHAESATAIADAKGADDELDLFDALNIMFPILATANIEEDEVELDLFDVLNDLFRVVVSSFLCISGTAF
ncbi:hypothetical protein OE88DRAFT_1261007 [Heliocybe sulcata]|uniref:Uncharacterized protein n=1 Tax=Heliocybe sulcata TaxID=5364 RepID=A0A5C3N8B5_9AGAM|nr:hypothetical protein OE88DRAFT_1261007 [Heliocybe sulcata]